MWDRKKFGVYNCGGELVGLNLFVADQQAG